MSNAGKDIRGDHHGKVPVQRVSPGLTRLEGEDSDGNADDAGYDASVIMIRMLFLPSNMTGQLTEKQL